MSLYYKVHELQVGTILESTPGSNYQGQFFRVEAIRKWSPTDDDAVVGGTWTDGSIGSGTVETAKSVVAFITWDEAVELYNKRHDQRQAAKMACDELRRCSGGKCDSGCDCEEKCDDCTDDRWNTTCNKCGSPAYIGLAFECSNPDCGGGY